ncbi:Clp protease N-terminal domain-containing protein [Streptacidiphilus sp. N1-10]|uniref:Clp protease N-terminal domain-containing protein n=1 Tax=Streptacidiphilus jeojiensis TaxID=3229225 RepID=A0ABV6Y1V0_9ACTN
MLAPVMARARRRAVRAGDAEIDSGHLLHALLESDEQVLGLAAPQPTQATRLMGYLAQRSIGFGRDWQQGEGESADEGTGIPRQRLALQPGLSDAAEAAVGRARVAALVRDAGEADPLDLLAELASDPGSRAAKMLKGAGADPSEVAVRARQR